MSNVNTKENVMLGSVVVIAVALMAIAGSAYGFLKSESGVVNEPIQNIGGLVHNQQETFDAGIAVNGTEVISSSRGISATTLAGTTSLTVGSGTATTKHLKTSGVVDVDSLGSGGATSSAITLTGAVSGGSAYVTRVGNWAAASSTVNVFAVPGTDSATIYFVNNSSTAVDLSSATYIVDYWAH